MVRVEHCLQRPRKSRRACRCSFSFIVIIVISCCGQRRWCAHNVRVLRKGGLYEDEGHSEVVQ